MKLVCISDTHGLHDKLELPAGDVLVHSGDATNFGKIAEVSKFFSWFEAQPHQHKVFVAGNHDVLFEENRYLARSMVPKNVHYLEDSGVTIEGVRFWGSPVQPTFCNWAFNRGTESIERHWELIPDDTDVLITHGPPYGILDDCNAWSASGIARNVGCHSLLDTVLRIKPKLHIFGHIHVGHGQKDFNGTHFINCAQAGDLWELANGPIVVDYQE